MSQEKITLKFITMVENYYNIQDSFETTFPDHKILHKVIEIYDDIIEDSIEIILDFLNVPEEKPINSYEDGNWTRRVCKSLILKAAFHPNLKKSAAELVTDWEKLDKYTKKVDSHDSFYYLELLEEHSSGFKKHYSKTVDF